MKLYNNMTEDEKLIFLEFIFFQEDTDLNQCYKTYFGV